MSAGAGGRRVWRRPGGSLAGLRAPAIAGEHARRPPRRAELCEGACPWGGAALAARRPLSELLFRAWGQGADARGEWLQPTLCLAPKCTLRPPAGDAAPFSSTATNRPNSDFEIVFEWSVSMSWNALSICTRAADSCVIGCRPPPSRSKVDTLKSSATVGRDLSALMNSILLISPFPSLSSSSNIP